MSKLKGCRVGNFAGEDLGRIDDLIVDFTTGFIRYVIVSLGGQLRAVPWELCSRCPTGHQFLIDTEKQTLLDAPAFGPAQWPDISHFTTKPYQDCDITYAGDYTGDDRLDKPDRDRV